MSPQPPEPPHPSTSPAAVPVLLFIVCMSLVGFGIVMPLLPYFAIAFDAKPWQVTLLFSAYSAGQFLGELFWGRLSDRIGRRPVLLITITASAVTYLAFAFAPGIWIAILVRAAGGFVSGYMSAIQAYIVDVSPPERLAGRLGWVGSAFGFGFAIGPALGGIMARSDMGAAGFRPPLILAGVLCVVAALGILAFVRESRRPGVTAAPKENPFAAIGEALRHPVIGPAFGTIFLGFFAGSSMWSVLGLWGDVTFDWGAREFGLWMAGTGVAAAATQGLFVGVLVRRIGAGATIAGGLAFYGACVLAMAAAPWDWLAGCLLIASVVGNAVWQPATTSIVSRSAPADRQGAILGASSASGSLARVAGPAVGGAIFSAVGPAAPIVFSAIFMLPAAWLGWRAARALRERLANAGE